MRLPFLILVALSFAWHSPASAAPRPIHLILDLSASMAEPADAHSSRPHESGAEVLVRSVERVLHEVDPRVPVTVLVFGHRIALDDRAGSCRDIETIFEGWVPNPAEFATRLGGLRPAGRTALAAALKVTRERISATRSEGARVVVVSDGEDTCGGDPASEARALRAAGADMRITVVAIRAEARAALQLKAIAREGGGIFVSAPEISDLVTKLRRALDLGAEPGDLGAARDAGSTPSEALVLPKAPRAPGYLDATDTIDVFRRAHRQGEKSVFELERIGARPPAATLRVMTSDGNVLATRLCDGDSARCESDVVDFPRDEDTFVSVSIPPRAFLMYRLKERELVTLDGRP